jgi:anionic cell wall polymer biosynthesis LytR-Cps2A-Psr (LCP) family protein
VPTSMVAFAARSSWRWTSILLLVTDSLPRSDPEWRLRTAEVRVDSILVAQSTIGCDALVVTALPRDLALTPLDEPLSMLLETLGPSRLANRVGSALSLRISAVVTVGFDAVAGVANAIGPVPIDLAVESRDDQVGFSGGPGLVELDGLRTIKFLRSRSWQERRGDDWVFVDGSDTGRVQRAQVYLEAAASSYRRASAISRLGAVVAGLKRSQKTIVDVAGTLAFARAAQQATRLDLRSAVVTEDRTDDERRSPFAPEAFGGFRNQILSPGQSFSLGSCPRPPGDP